MLHVALRVPREHAQLVLCPRVLQVRDFKGPLAVDEILLDRGFTTPGLSNHHVKVADVFSRRHVPRRLPTLVLLVTKKYSFRYPRNVSLILFILQ